MSRCINSGCSHFGNTKKQGYCNACASSHIHHLPYISETKKCTYDHCHVRRHGGFGGDICMVNGLDLPTGFTKIVDRTPIPGDVILTVVIKDYWMSNSVATIATVNEADGTALVHFDCSTLSVMSYKTPEFVVIEP